MVLVFYPVEGGWVIALFLRRQQLLGLVVAYAALDGCFQIDFDVSREFRLFVWLWECLEISGLDTTLVFAPTLYILSRCSASSGCEFGISLFDSFGEVEHPNTILFSFALKIQISWKLRIKISVVTNDLGISSRFIH